jgi:hypothetical protein
MTFGLYGVGGTGPVADIATLSSSVAIRTLPDGYVIFVLSTQQYYRLSLTSGATADGVNVVASFGGAAAARWIRVTIADAINTYTLQAAWFIDSATGSDANDGLTSLTPLKTFAEIVRRWGPNPVLQQTTTITISSAGLPASDPIRFSGVGSTRSDRVLIIRGTMIATGMVLNNGGVLDAAQAINHGAADGGQRVTITTGGNQDWTGALGKFLQINGGARDGAKGTPLKNAVAAGTTRTGSFKTIPVGGAAFTAVQVSPAAGDAMQVVSPTVVGAPLYVYDCPIQIRFENLEFLNDAAPSGQLVRDNDFVIFNFCTLHGFEKLRGTALVIFQGCFFPADTLIASLGGHAYLLGCAALGTGDTQIFTGEGTIDLDTMFQGAFASFAGFPLSSNVVGDVAFYDLTNAGRGAIAALGAPLSLAPTFSATAVIYGTGIAGYTFLLQNMAAIGYTSTANFLAVGATSLIRYSGANKVVGDLPLAVDIHNNSMVVLS